MALVNTVSFRPWQEGQQMAKIALDGSLDSPTAPQLEKELLQILAGPTQIIVFDLAKLNFMSAGSATMNVVGVENIRGHATYHTVFDVRGKVLFFHVNDHYESWFDTTSLISLHHVKHQDESSYSADLTYDFYPEKKTYVRNGVENPSVADPTTTTSVG